MAGVEIRSENLPSNLQDLGAFVLVGREKLVAVRAEIRAIDKLNLAEEVRQQKMDEARMLSEALLDAEVRIGELTKLIPKADAGRPKLIPDSSVYNLGKGDSWQIDSGVCFDATVPIKSDSDVPFDNQEKISDTAVTSLNVEKTKDQVITDMGFNKKQVSRFETLADNKDLVERVKAEAREAEVIPTRGKVLELAKERKEERNPYYAKVDNERKILNDFRDAIYKPSSIEVTADTFTVWKKGFTEYDFDIYMHDIDQAIFNLSTIKTMLVDSQKIRVVRGGKR